jgi:hypothetical protein
VPPLVLRDLLLDQGKLLPVNLKLLVQHERQLVERMPGGGQIAAQLGRPSLQLALVLLLLQVRLLAAAMLGFRQHAPRHQLPGRGEIGLEQGHALLLQSDLLFNVADFGAQAVQQIGKARRFVAGKLLLRRDPPLQAIPLTGQALLDRRLHAFHLAGEPPGRHREERLPRRHHTAVLHVHGSNRARLRGEDAGGAGGGRQIARRRLFPGVLGEEQQGDNQTHATDQKPRRQLDGHRLDQRHLAPLAMLLLEVEGLLSKKGALLSQLYGSLPFERRTAGEAPSQAPPPAGRLSSEFQAANGVTIAHLACSRAKSCRERV